MSHESNFFKCTCKKDFEIPLGNHDIFWIDCDKEYTCEILSMNAIRVHANDRYHDFYVTIFPLYFYTKKELRKNKLQKLKK